MLSEHFGYRDVVVGSGNVAGIRDVILQASLELARCRQGEIGPIISKILRHIGAIEQAEQVGWYLLEEPGILSNIFPSTPYSSSIIQRLKDGFQQSPWYLAQLDTGKPVVLYSPDELLPVGLSDQAILKDSEIQSFLVLLSTPLSLAKTVLVFSFNLAPTKWPEEIVEQYMLLRHIFASAYQRLCAQTNSQVEMEYFQKLLSSSRNPMAMLNAEGQFLLSNQSLSALLGYTEEELQRLTLDNISSLLGSRDKFSLEEPSLHLLLSQHSERTFIRKDQSPLSAMATIDLVERTSLEETIFLMSLEDLTKQKLEEIEIDRRQIEVDTLASMLVQSQESDWRRLSRDLHDDIGQRLSLMTSEVALMASQASTEPSPYAERLEGLRCDLDELCTDIHEMSHDLHSYKLQHLGLRAALKDLCRRLSSERFRIDLRVDDMDEPHSEDISLCLYRVTQEALNNARTHAHTPAVAVILTKLQSVFYLMIQDAGVGFDSTVQPHGLGLISMRERIKLVRGTFRIHSSPQRGTDVWVAVPDIPEIPSPTYQC